MATTHPLAMLLTVAWATVSAQWPTGVFLASEILFGRRVARLSDEESFTCPPRNREWERMVYLRCMAWGLGSYVVVAALALAATWYWLGR